ncbi:MAG: thiol reductase thioredoxin [Bacteroidetes bacterium GWA2_31_9b]|nr:MAG: thiol reductase thioredoxin [Bacteroidetes bacterium GWA2_31_9b]
MIKNITSLAEINKCITKDKALLIYFSNTNCNVCKVLKPKIYDLLSAEFPLMKMYYCDTIEFPEISAQNSIFTVPTILVFFNGKEFIRKSRNIGITELQKEIERPYMLMFNE